MRSSDIKGFIKNKFKATEKMRSVAFNMKNRIKLAPVEFIGGIKIMSLVILGFFVLSGINSAGYSLELLFSKGIFSAAVLALSFLFISILGPLLLPYLPGRAFSFKGISVGILIILPIIILSQNLK